MSDFCIRFPQTVSGDELYDEFRKMAADELESEYRVDITSEEIFSIDALKEKMQNPEEYTEMKRRQGLDERDLDRSRSSFFHIPSGSRAADWFLSATKPGLELTVKRQRTASWKDFIAPVRAEFAVDPDRDYRSLNEQSTKYRYNADEVDVFEPFARELIERLGMPVNDSEQYVTTDLYSGDDADGIIMKGAGRTKYGPRGLRPRI